MQIGDAVSPVRGRDSGRVMLIVGRSGDMLLIADGKVRPIDRPKKKKPKHVKWIATLSGAVSDKLRSGEKVTGAELRRTISEFSLAVSPDGGVSNGEG